MRLQRKGSSTASSTISIMCPFLNTIAMIISQFCSWLAGLVRSLLTRSSDHGNWQWNRIFGKLGSFIRRCIFGILSVGPVPYHVAFIMDGNRRYAKKHGLKEKDGYRAGFFSLMSLLKYCYELKIKYISIYAFSIDNFRRRPGQIRIVMELMQEKIEGILKEEGLVNEYGIKVHFVGNLKLLSQDVQSCMNRVMKATAHNTRAILLVCVAYTSTDDILHAVQESIQYKRGSKFGHSNEKWSEIEVSDIERHMYMAVGPDLDILIRSSGETRLSNYMLWQTVGCLLYSPAALWPELGLRHLVWSVLSFQRHYNHLQNIRKQATYQINACS